MPMMRRRRRVSRGPHSSIEEGGVKGRSPPLQTGRRVIPEKDDFAPESPCKRPGSPTGHLSLWRCPPQS